MHLKQQNGADFFIPLLRLATCFIPKEKKKQSPPKKGEKKKKKNFSAYLLCLFSFTLQKLFMYGIIINQQKLHIILKKKKKRL
jgi:hypothetical protein